jgi:hypothetical protein
MNNQSSGDPDIGSGTSNIPNAGTGKSFPSQNEIKWITPPHGDTYKIGGLRAARLAT